jgi:predicted anti-sigma-YlaC factor YlaD
MTCEELLTYLSDYLDHDLDEELTQVAQEHLSTCQNCQVVLNTTQRVIVLGHGQARRMIPAERRAHLFDSLQAAFLNRQVNGD